MDISALYKCFTECGKVTTDSRNCPEGSMFIALKGETFNGNAYALQALEKGCQYAVVDEKEYAADGHPRILLVDDCLKALQELANYHRHKMGTRIIGITGTNGKTTTKELIASVLQKRYEVLYTQGNLNNHIGVPLTLLRLTPEHELQSGTENHQIGFGSQSFRFRKVNITLISISHPDLCRCTALVAELQPNMFGIPFFCGNCGIANIE